MFWFKKSKFNGREYREETSRKISWGHWFAFFNIIISILIGSRYASLSGTAFSVALVIALIGQTLLNSLTGIISQGYSIVVYPYMMIVSLLIMLLLFKRSLK